MIRGIHHIAIHTPNLDRLRDFYVNAFNFEPVGEEVNLKDFAAASLIVGVPNAEARSLMMKAGNCYIELFEWSAPFGGVVPPRNAYDFGYTHFMVDVSDIDSEYDRLSALGMTFVHPSAVRFGDAASVYGRDPDGNLIEIGELPVSHGFHLQIESGLTPNGEALTALPK
jgi:glyoxylase I family protein